MIYKGKITEDRTRARRFWGNVDPHARLRCVKNGTGYEDLVKAGVIDPTKVTRTALQNAASIASLMLTTEAVICQLVEEVDK